MQEYLVDKTSLVVHSPKLFLSYILGFDLQPFHKEWLDLVDRNRFTLILAPRGSGKSTVVTVGYSLWKALMDPQLRVLIVSNTQSQAETFLRLVRNLCVSGKVADIFGDVVGSVWTNTELEFKGHGNQKEMTITALGASGALVGRHFDVIMLDDICDGKNMATENRRSKVYEWYFQTLLPMLEPDGELHIIGTRWHEDDFYNRIKGGNYKTKIYKALNGRKSYWEERYPYELLKKLRAESPTTFEMQYQNEIVHSEDAIFKERYFKYYTVLPDNVEFYQGIDLAASERGDYFVIVTIAIDKQTNDIYVVNVFRQRLSLSRQIEAIIKMAEKYKPMRIGIESNGYQLALASEMIKRSMLPIKKVYQERSKIDRASKLSVLFENGTIFLPERRMRLIDELLVFPRGKYDDCVDALDLAVSVAKKRMTWSWDEIRTRIFAGNYVAKV